MLLHRLGGIRDGAVQVDREPLERNRPRDVAQVVEHALDDDQLALDRLLERLAVLDVLEHLLNQLAAVADVLDRVRQIVHQAGGDAAEHRLPFLLADFFLQLDQPVGHRVEGVAELPDFVLPDSVDALVHAAVGDRARDARQREDALDEGSAPHPAEHDRAEQRQADGREQLPLERVRDSERIARSAVRRGRSSAGCRPPRRRQQIFTARVVELLRTRLTAGSARRRLGELSVRAATPPRRSQSVPCRSGCRARAASPARRSAARSPVCRP